MLDQLDTRLAKLAEDRARCESAAARLKSARADRERLERRCEEARELLSREQADVDRLEGSSMAALFHTLLGNKVEKLAEEQRELVAAELELAGREQALGELEAEVQHLERESEPLEQLRMDYDALLREKERWIQAHGGPAGAELLELAEREGQAKDELREVGEAYSAANDVRRALKQCADSLESASNWGVYDMVGGGLVASVVKHGKMDEANEAAAVAQRALGRLERELADLGRSAKLEVRLEGLERFGDLFLDGLLFDWVSQSKIGRSRENVDKTIRRVRSLQERLEARDTELRALVDSLLAERRQRVADWS